MTSMALGPSVRSRLAGSITTFAIGFVLANYAIVRIERPDLWLWIGGAAVLMLTGAVGVLVADSGGAVSVWSVLGVEVFALVTLVPLLWVFTVATTPDGERARALWPGDISWAAFGDVLSSDVLRHAAGTSVLVAGVATVASVPLALGAAYALTRHAVRGGRVVYAFVLAALLMPLVALATPWADQVIALDRYDSRLALVVPSLVITLPLAIWLSVTVLRDVPWTLLESVRADGGTRLDAFRHFVAPRLGPEVVVVTILVFLVGTQDFVLGAALAAGDESRTLPATLLLSTGEIGNRSATIAAAGLLWLLPSLVLLLVLPRKVSHLLGRSYR